MRWLLGLAGAASLVAASASAQSPVYKITPELEAAAQALEVLKSRDV